MDYFGMVKRAWHITWRYRVLWLFGFLAGAAGGGSSPNISSYTQSSSNLTAEQTAQVDQVAQWAAENLALLISVAALLTIVVICLWIISIAARGGLVHLASQADEGIAPTVREGFSVGFHLWGRVFLIDFLIYVPFALVVALVVTPTIVLPIIAAVQADSAGSGGAIVAAILGMIGVLLLELVILGLIGMVLGLIEQLALRHGVLGGTTATESIRTAWHDIRTRFMDVFLMWLVTLGIGLAVGIAFGAVGAMFGVVIFGAAITGMWPVAIGVGLIMALVFIVPGAIVSAYYSTLWTVFYRRFTGRAVDGAASPAPAWAPAGEPAHASDLPAPGLESPADFLPPPPSVEP